MIVKLQEDIFLNNWAWSIDYETKQFLPYSSITGSRISIAIIPERATDSLNNIYQRQEQSIPIEWFLCCGKEQLPLLDVYTTLTKMNTLFCLQTHREGWDADEIQTGRLKMSENKPGSAQNDYCCVCIMSYYNYAQLSIMIINCPASFKGQTHFLPLLSKEKNSGVSIIWLSRHSWAQAIPMHMDQQNVWGM